MGLSAKHASHAVTHPLTPHTIIMKLLVENICKKATGACREVSSASLEEEIFQDSHFLENNVFSTSHQMVNVYGLPDKRYEVRSEDNAVDIQLHG